MFKNKNFWVIFIIFALCLVGIFVFKNNILLRENFFIHEGPRAYPLFRGREVVQEIGKTSKRNKLAGFSLQFKKTNTVEHFLKVVLKVENEGIKAFKTDVSTRQIKGEKFYDFWLEEPVVLGDQLLKLEFSANVSSESASITPVVSGTDNYPGGRAYLMTYPRPKIIKQELLPGDVSFKPIFQVGISEFLGFYLNKIAFGKPLLFNKFVLLFILICWLVSLFGFWFWCSRLIIGNSNRVLKLYLGVLIWLLLVFLVLFYNQPTSFILESTGRV